MMDSKRILRDATGRALAALGAGACLLLLGAGTARAAIDPSTVQPAPLSATASGCASLPVSQREFCMSQVGWAAIQPAPVAIDQAASSRAAAQMAACKKLPVSDMFMCEDQVGYGQQVRRGAAPSASQEIALRSENARYEAAAAACKRGPLSDVNMCLSLAGNDASLRSTS